MDQIEEKQDAQAEEIAELRSLVQQLQIEKREHVRRCNKQFGEVWKFLRRMFEHFFAGRNEEIPIQMMDAIVITD